jgi:heptosyltransferase-2/heptosyltransferase-3
MAPKAICLFKINYLGDAITFLPTVRGVRDALPNTPIVIVCSTATASLYLGTFDNLSVVSISRDKANGSRALRQLPRLVKEIGVRNNAVALLSNDEPTLSVLAAYGSARKRIGFSQAPARVHWMLSEMLPATAGRNMIDLNFDLVRKLTRKPALKPRRTPVGYTDADIKVVMEKLSGLGISKGEPFVLIHPFGKKRYQMWGLDNYKALARVVETSGLKCVFLSGGPSEKVGDDAKVISGITVNQLAALCATARIFVGSNSGPMHVSSAMGTPTLVIQGATAREWDIFWDDVPHKQLAATHLPCVPCERFGAVIMECTNRESPMACMDAISVERAHSELTSLLSRSDPPAVKIRERRLRQRRSSSRASTDRRQSSRVSESF